MGSLGSDLGFDLGASASSNSQMISGDPRFILLGGHGAFTWGDTAYECYMNSLEVIEIELC